MKVWILTEEYNDYDQHGGYFVAVFKDKPTPEQLEAVGVGPTRINHVLTGGGREKWEDQWFLLGQEDLK